MCSSLCTWFVLRRAQWTLNKLWCHVKGDSAVREGASKSHSYSQSERKKHLLFVVEDHSKAVCKQKVY